VEEATQHDKAGPSGTQREEKTAGASASTSSAKARTPLLTARCLARLLHAVVRSLPSMTRWY
jgi:hypothetical protein